jgi:hypothetical protein
MTFAYFRIVANVQPSIIRAFITMQPDLLELQLELYIGAHDSVKDVADDGSRCLSSCTDNPFLRGPPITIPQRGYVLRVLRGCRPTWEPLMSRISKTDETRTVGSVNSKVEREVVDWLLLRPTLQKITVMWSFTNFPPIGLYDATGPG